MPVPIILIRAMVQGSANIHRTPRTPLRVPAALFALLLGLACAGDGGGAADATPDGPPPPPAAPAPAPERPDAPAPPDERGAEPVAGAEFTTDALRTDRPATGAAVLRAIRTARHEGFDRIVLDFGTDPVPGHRISYIDPPAHQCGSGAEITVAGDAVLAIGVEPAYAHTEDTGQPTVRERNRAPGLPALTELKLICDFEAVVELLAGVSARTPYRAFTLGSPSRIVIDIAHPEPR